MKMKKEMQGMLRSIQFYNPGLEENILKSFIVCDRVFFVKKDIYADMPQHIAHGQTISQPTTIARMLRMLKLEPSLDVLEIGTNTGYHAALTQYIIYPGKVNTIEIYKDLAQAAKKNLKNLINHLPKRQATKISKINVFAGDALDKKTPVWKQKYDRIYFTAGVDEKQIKKVHEMAEKLLREDGFILYPTHEVYYSGALEIWQLKNKQLELIKRLDGYAFVPLLSNTEFKGKVKYKVK